MSLGLTVAFLLQASAAPALPEGEALAAAVATRSQALFDIAFNRCDPAAMRSMVIDDLEFYHDRDGVHATNADQFVSAYEANCTSRQEPGAWRSRRELVPEGYAVYPVPGFGAIEEGDHLFYERQGEGAEQLVGRAHFVTLWQLTPDGWKAARILSYAHEAAGE